MSRSILSAFAALILTAAVPANAEVGPNAAPIANPIGPGAVSGAPHLPAGFNDIFTSRYVDVGGLRLHAVVGGKGPPLLLVHGWPQTWYQWRLVMPVLARDFQVIAVDQRGIGLSDKPKSGYDAGTQAKDLVSLMEALGHKKFAMIGFDTGMPIAYALAADTPDRVERLVVGESPIAGVSPSIPLIVPGPLNKRLWHIPFNRLGAEVNERLIQGREDIYFGSEFATSAGTPLPDAIVKYYVDRLASSSDALSGSFGSYRAIDTDIAQNQGRKTRRLTLPVLAVGGEKGFGEGTAKTMRLVADNVQTAIIPGSGHWVAEEAPDQLLAALAPFLEPYRNAPSK
ncbi:alpha/beta fold hydrolase [Mesorhizobium escarrei]|uniref:Alpha/beta hydrolase n=1 Tax=Mesorhizobium escarrei TaxID=666018 RepID=A0ABM9EFA2_9HYPH|nr:alpha/beta hydrolase [Mesorhizobium escarrei]CAH2407936.1 Alpha/beta hydrolase [Mesorhizobium escarrei]